ncbi:tetraspanin 4 [Rhinolophus ferrumequinum]|uniref:Tetraspanin-4 n=1 Tax=Rhinolophus ferrumequinum TaxID=59479 RepID=A0A7J7WBR7_RHIFE|nr:tetraspanin 4 [Rhinolophus ferrumequinum]
MARGCLQGVKYLMFAFNLLFWLGGCGILGVGIWLAATQGNFATLSSSFPSLSAANLLIVTGSLVMAIGFVGCIGAIKEHRCLLLTFFVMLLLVFLLEATVAILFFAYTDKIDRYAQRDLKKGLHLYGTPGNVGLTNAWSIIQTDFRCCGVSNYTDWFEVYNATRVPDSCCLEFSESCGLHAPGTWWKAVSPRPGPGTWGWRAGLTAPEWTPTPVSPAFPPAVLRDGEDVAPRKPAGSGCLWAVHSARAGPGPDLRHDHVLPGGEGRHLLCVGCPLPATRFAARGHAHRPGRWPHRTVCQLGHGGGGSRWPEPPGPWPGL